MEKLAEELRITDETEHWLRIGLESRSESLKYLEDASKQMVGIASLLQGMYFAAISFSDIKKASDIHNIWFVVFVGFSIVILTIWMISLYFAMHVLIPETYFADLSRSDPVQQALQIRKAFEKILEYKRRNLRRASKLLWLSFIPLAINLLIYLVYIPPPPP